MKLWVASHNDDAPLWGTFTILREKPIVLTVYDSYLQVERGHPDCDAISRRREDMEAIRGVLDCQVHFAGLADNALIKGAMPLALSKWEHATEVWLPAVEKDGHDQHNLVGEIGGEVFKAATIHHYLTYTRTRGKSTNGTEVKPTGVELRKKLQALACYKTQLEIDALGCWPHFMDQREFLT